MHIFAKGYEGIVKNPCYSNVVWVPVEAPKGIKLIGVSWSTRGTKE